MVLRCARGSSATKLVEQLFLSRLDWKPVTEERQLKCLSPRREANKIVYVFVSLLSCLAI